MTLPSSGRPVVAGVDGSDLSMEAAVYAAEEAGRRGVRLLLVHATPWRPVDADDRSEPQLGDRLARSAEMLLGAAASEVQARTGLSDVATAVLDDHPVPALTSASAQASVLVLGRRGITGLTGVLAGSTASGVVHHAQCPVIVLPEEEWAPEAGAHSVVVAVEGRPDDDEVLAFAVAAAAARHTDLVAVHAWRDVTLEAAAGGVAPWLDLSAVEGEEQRLLAEAVAGRRDKEPDLVLREVVVRERPAVALLGAAGAAELLVVGHRHRRALARLGSTVHGLLHRTPCPLAVVPLIGGGS